MFLIQLRKNSLKLLALLAAIVLFSAACSNDNKYTGWRVKGGTPDGIQYTSLSQITPGNVNNLKVAWTYVRHDADTATNRTQIQCNPIVVNGILYATSANLTLFALDAKTGKEIWTFSPAEENSTLGVNRGVTYWEDKSGSNQDSKADKRILYSFGEYLYAIDPISGKKIETFGDRGRVSLKEGLGERSKDLMVISNTPGVIFDNLIIMGSRVHEGPLAAPGYIRAFDVVSGKLIWTFHTIPHPGEFGYDTWPADAWKKVGGANCWSGMTVDHERGLVFAATGSASFDFYGGNRKGQNLFANCVLALDARTGNRKWHYQTTHHDIWDRDLPAAPLLVTVKHNGHDIDAVIQVTKQGFVFLLNRDTGEPLFPVEEKPFPKSALEGEETWPTQPVPTKPAPFARQVFTEDMINSIDVPASFPIIEKFKTLRTGTQFNPPSKEGTIIFPGFDGGAEWGGPSFDPATGILYINSNEMPWILTMVDVRMNAKTSLGSQLFQTYCASCHGLDRSGDPQHGYPSLEHADQKFNPSTLSKFISKGKGMMPAFASLKPDERDAIAHYLLNLDEKQKQGEKGAFERHPEVLFSNTGYNRFVNSEGYPAVEPPWGTLNAIDMNTGETQWQVSLGEFEELKSKGIPPTGTENYGGSVNTKSGLIFIAATHDEKIRAFDKEHGKVLWEYKLPFGGYATPAIYEVDGQEFIVVACGGGKMGTKSGDVYVAFSLKDE